MSTGSVSGYSLLSAGEWLAQMPQALLRVVLVMKPQVDRLAEGSVIETLIILG